MLRLASLALAAAFSFSALAEPVTFDFKDPKGINGVTFLMDSSLEPIVGTVAGVAGTVTYDPADPTSLSGHVSVDLGTDQLREPGHDQGVQGPEVAGVRWLLPRDHALRLVGGEEYRRPR